MCCDHFSSLFRFNKEWSGGGIEGKSGLEEEVDGRGGGYKDDGEDGGRMWMKKGSGLIEEREKREKRMKEER